MSIMAWERTEEKGGWEGSTLFICVSKKSIAATLTSGAVTWMMLVLPAGKSPFAV